MSIESVSLVGVHYALSGLIGVGCCGMLLSSVKANRKPRMGLVWPIKDAGPDGSPGFVPVPLSAMRPGENGDL